MVTSNAITGALMVLSLQQMLAGSPLAGIWEYDGTAQSTRISVRSERPACQCHLQSA